MKKLYIEPVTEVSVFEAEDIITASLDSGAIGGDREVYSPIQWQDEINPGN